MEKNSNPKSKELMIYTPLPPEVRQTLEKQCQSFSSIKTSLNEGEKSFVVDYLQTRTGGNMDEISSQLKKNFPLLTAKPVKENSKKRNKRKVLTSIERRKLGLHKLPKTGLKYKSFGPLHQLWREYMEHVLELETSTSETKKDMLYQRIAKADYHGCLLMVTRSKCPAYIGSKGIVVLETKNTFQIICEDDKLRIIPKRDSIFTFNISRWTFTLIGNNMNVRPSERAARKFKSKPTIDL